MRRPGVFLLPPPRLALAAGVCAVRVPLCLDEREHWTSGSEVGASTPRPAWYHASMNQAERLTIEAERAWQVARAEAC